MYSSLSLFFLFLHLIFRQGKAQTLSHQIGIGSQNQDAVSSFQPSLAVVIGILAIMFSLTFILLLYAKFCRNNSNNHPDTLQNHVFDGLPRSRSRLSGIDKTVIESLPFFRFSSLKGSRGGLECIICLSKFEDIELLRLLPKCKHAFHMNCLDQWLEKHSSCPLCRDKLSADDLAAFNYSTSLRFLWNQSEHRQESNLELYVQREQSHHGSSRFSVAGSFRKLDKEKKEDELPIHPKDGNNEDEDDQLHKFNHRITVNDSVLMKNRWSNVSSSDLMFLNSELLNEASSTRFSALQSGFHGNNQLMNPTRLIGGGEIMNIKEEMERKREFESKIQQNESFPPLPNLQKASDIKRDAKDSRICPSEKRSMSEIAVFPRTYRDDAVRVEENSGNEEKMRRIWLPIARRTVEWFANRERGTNQNQNITITEP